MGETKPLKLSAMLSIAYSDLMADFEKLRPVKGSSILPIWDGGQQSQTEPT